MYKWQPEGLDIKIAIVGGLFHNFAHLGWKHCLSKVLFTQRPEKLALSYEWALLLQSKLESQNITFYDPLPPHELLTGNICELQCS